MKILYHISYQEGYGDDRFIYDGYRRAFLELGHEVQPFTERDDLRQTLASFKPDIFITSLHAPNWHLPTISPILQDYRKQGGAVFMRAGRLDPASHAELIDLIKKDQLADLYYADCELPKEYFEDLTGKEGLFLPLAGDKRENVNVPPMKKYQCDLIYIGANLPMKKDIFERRLYPLMKKYDVKVFGGDWGAIDKYILHPLAKIDRMLNLGGMFSRMRISRQVPIGEEIVAYQSAKIALNFHERHGSTPPCMNGRIFRIPAAGGFEICDSVPGLRNYFTADEMPMPETDEEFFAAVEYYLTHDAERKAMQARAVAKALSEHTWHNRAETMLAWYQGLG